MKAIGIIIMVVAVVFGVHSVAGSLTSPAAVLLLTGVALAAIVVVFGLLRLQDLLSEYGAGLLLSMIVWHHSGLPHHGEPATNATWHYRGTRALTETGHARRCYYWPKKKLAYLRCTRSFVLLAATFGLVSYRPVTVWLLLAAALAWVWWAGRRFWDWIDDAGFHRRYTQPAHLAAAHLAEIPLTYKPQGWLDIERDRTKVTAHLPLDYQPEDRQDAKLIEALSRRIGIEEPVPTWKLAGDNPRLIIQTAPHAPGLCTLSKILPAIVAADWDELVLGAGKPHLGRPQLIKVSLSDDSPHLGMSMGSGAGKTTLSRLVVAQWLLHGGVVYILNPKRRGYQWAKGLHNVAVAELPEQCFMMLNWLGSQLDERNEKASAHADWDDRTPDGLLGDRILVVVEELNMLVSRQKKYWRHNKELAAQELGWDEDTPLPKDSPALDALDDLAFAGRQSEIFVQYIGQRLSAKVISGDVLENVGIRMLGRFSQRTVNMMAPDLSQAMPPSDSHPGRIQVIANGEVRECQVAYTAEAWAYRALALMGLGQLPPNLPSMCHVGSAHPSQPALTPWARDTARDTARAGAGSASGRVSLKAAVARGLTYDLTYRALDNLRCTDPDFPQPAVFKDHAFGAHLYDEDRLEQYCESVVMRRRIAKRARLRKQGMLV